MQVKAILTKPLDGHPEGAEREFDKPDFDRLVTMGAVRAAPDERRATEEAVAEDEKKAPAPLNKRALAPLNKKAPSVENKDRVEI